MMGDERSTERSGRRHGSGGVAGAVVVFLLALVAGPVAGQGWIEPPASILNGFSVEKTRSEVAVRVEGRVAVVEVSEWFRNGGARVAEGHYLYPLPGEAVFQGFSLFQGDLELRGEIMDAREARRIYEEIVRRRADPALIELAGEGLLRARVFPIEPGDERKVTLRYTQVLERAGDALQFLYAGATRGAVGGPPRILPADGDGGTSRATRGFAGGAETRFALTVEDGDAFLDPFSPTHPISVERDGEELRVRVESRRLEGRFSLFLPLARDRVGISVATHRPPGEDGYVMLTLSPGRDPGRAEPRDVTVVVDVSGSMSGEKMEQARAALHGLLASLSEQDRFRLLSFSNAVRMEREGWAPADARALRQARAWVDALVADGGTNIEGALREAFRAEQPGDRLPVMVFLTDGLPSVGERDPERLADWAETGAGRARIFAFGIGPDVNTHLLDRLGEAGRGSTGYVQPGENVERAVSLLAAKVRHPVLTDLEIAGAPVRLQEIYPVRLPDLFAGEELVVFGRYTGEGEGRVRIRGRRGGGDAGFQVEAAFPRTEEANGYIPRLWASRKLGHLTRQIWTEGETQGLVEEIRRVALRYGLPSPYTSYLVQEPGTVVAQQAPGPWPASQPRALALDQIVVTGAATAPANAVGAGAVRQAEEARRLREARSVEALAAMEMERQDSLARADGSGGVRTVAGRVFQLRDGIWMDVAHREAQERVRVEAFSPAYFALLSALEEFRRVVTVLEPVVVAGAEVSLETGPAGRDTLSTREVEDLVRRFRGSGGR